jgi:hypothetical protein
MSLRVLLALRMGVINVKHERYGLCWPFPGHALQINYPYCCLGVGILSLWEARIRKASSIQMRHAMPLF